MSTTKQGVTYRFRWANLDVWMRVDMIASGVHWITWINRFSPEDNRLWNPDTVSSYRIDPNNWTRVWL